MKIYKNLFQQIVSSENLFASWDEYRDLATKQYRHQTYTGFYIRDPKVRHIHKASVLDRIVHHAVFRILNPIFDKTFIPTSFSCRIDKGVHKGVLMLERMIRSESKNFTRPCFVLKCDVQKFFDSIDHQILLSILRKKISDSDTLWLLNEIVESFSTKQANLFDRQGLPIGNLTSRGTSYICIPGRLPD